VPLQSVLDQVETLNSIASSFSEFAKMPSPEVKKVEVHSVLKSSIELFTGDKDLDIQLELAGKDIFCLVDPELLSRIFNNLLLNAKQSIKPNQAKVNVVVKTIINDRLEIHISDNGMGILPEIRDKVFIPKFTTKAHGSGIGLAMTKYGVENMQGSIYFNSDLNVGTEFVIEFPILT
jgi:nitrogen fixation/metabolism regulation signal transduction histidine kinase